VHYRTVSDPVHDPILFLSRAPSDREQRAMKKRRQGKVHIEVLLASTRDQTLKEVRSRIRTAIPTTRVTVVRCKRRSSVDHEPFEYSVPNWTVH